VNKAGMSVNKIGDMIRLATLFQLIDKLLIRAVTFNFGQGFLSQTKGFI
jgi:hypothetical protein